MLLNINRLKRSIGNDHPEAQVQYKKRELEGMCIENHIALNVLKGLMKFFDRDIT